MKRAYLISLGALAGLLAAAYGCGGVGGVDGLFNGGSGGAASSADGQMQGSSNAGSTSGSADGSTSSASSGSGTSASSSGSGEASSSSAASSSSSAASSSSSSGGGPTTIPCGNAMCPLGNMNACCWTSFNKAAMCVQGTPQNDNCNTDATPGGFQTRIECNVPADCPGAICCGHLGAGQSYYNTVMCQPTCDTNAGYVVVCDPMGPNTCQGGTSCQQSSLLPQGYSVCK